MATPSCAFTQVLEDEENLVLLFVIFIVVLR